MKIGIEITAADDPGVLHQLTGVIARRDGNIRSIQIVEQTGGDTRIYFEVELPAEPEALIAKLGALSVVRHAAKVETMEQPLQ